MFIGPFIREKFIVLRASFPSKLLCWYFSHFFFSSFSPPTLEPLKPHHQTIPCLLCQSLKILHLKNKIIKITKYLIPVLDEASYDKAEEGRNFMRSFSSRLGERSTRQQQKAMKSFFFPCHGFWDETILKQILILYFSQFEGGSVEDYEII